MLLSCFFKHKSYISTKKGGPSLAAFSVQLEDDQHHSTTIFVTAFPILMT